MIAAQRKIHFDRYFWVGLLALGAPCSGVSAQSELGVSKLSKCVAPDGATFVKGVLPDTKTAGLVALQILKAIYGSKLISKQLPLKIEARPDRYIINGVRSASSIGGNATIVLCRANGAVIYLSHSK